MQMVPIFFQFETVKDLEGNFALEWEDEGWVKKIVVFLKKLRKKILCTLAFIVTMPNGILDYERSCVESYISMPSKRAGG